MDTPQPNEHCIQIENRCHISEEKLEIFVRLFSELLPITSIPNETHLERIIFIANGEMEQTVNEILREDGKTTGSYSAGATAASATAVPIEKNGNLCCHIVISESDMQSLSSKYYHPWPLVSSLLEELFHICLYSTTWERRGSVHPPLSLPAQERDFFILCANLHDEYAVARLKTSVLTTVPLVDGEGGLTVAYPRYGQKIAPMLEQAALSLRHTIHNISSSFETRNQLLQIVYRGVFEPLGRDAGFRAGTPPAQLQSEDRPTASTFFRKHVFSYWEQVKEQLERSFESHFTETDAALDEIRSIIGTFLSRIDELYS